MNSTCCTFENKWFFLLSWAISSSNCFLFMMIHMQKALISRIAHTEAYTCEIIKKTVDALYSDYLHPRLLNILSILLSSVKQKRRKTKRVYSKHCLYCLLKYAVQKAFYIFVQITIFPLIRKYGSMYAHQNSNLSTHRK